LAVLPVCCGKKPFLVAAAALPRSVAYFVRGDKECFSVRKKNGTRKLSIGGKGMNMKKMMYATVVALTLSAAPALYGGRGGDSFVGGLAGGITGSAIGSAITHKGDSGKAEARRAQDQVEQLRREQYEQALRQREREGQQSPLFYLLIFFVIVLLGGVAVMSAMLFRRRPGENSRR